MQRAKHKGALEHSTSLQFVKPKTQMQTFLEETRSQKKKWTKGVNFEVGKLEISSIDISTLSIWRCYKIDKS